MDQTTDNPTQSEKLEPPNRIWLPADTDADTWNVLAKNPSRDWATGEPANNIEYVRAPVVAPEGDVLACMGRFPTPSQADDDYPCDECGVAKAAHGRAALLWDSLAHNLSSLTSRMANKECGPVWDSFWALDAYFRTPTTAPSPSPVPPEQKLWYGPTEEMPSDIEVITIACRRLEKMLPD